MGAYDVVTWRGRRFDRRTIAGIEHAEQLARTLYGADGTVPLFQGSYNRGVTQSAGTHDEGAAVDTGRMAGLSWLQQEWCFRLAGFAYWVRDPDDGDWDWHGHGIQLGNRAASPSAKRQVSYYRLGLNGLANHARDRHRRPDPILGTAYPLGVVDLSNVRRQSELSRGWTSTIGVRRVQRSLNVKIDADLAVDGIWGPVTRRAFALWERNVNGDGDGLPTMRGLTLLGAARFRVKP